MSKTKLRLDPLGLGKALFATNLFSGVCIVALASFTGIDMKSSGWNLLLGFPVFFAVAGFVYGAIGATVYNFLAKEDKVHITQE